MHEFPGKTEEFEIKISGSREEKIFSPAGRLDSSNATAAIKILSKALEAGIPARVIFDLEGLTSLDDFGVAVLAGLKQKITAQNSHFILKNERGAVKELLAFHAFENMGLPPLISTKAPPGMISRLGASILELLGDQIFMTHFLGASLFSFQRFLRHPRSLRWQDTLQYMQKTGVDALPIVTTISFLLGLIMAFMSSVQLQQFGANIYVASLVSLSMTRELGPIMTAIIVAGRSGSAFAAEIGTMKISEEIDALKTMGFDPHLFLVLPKVVAACLVVPMLTLFSDLAAILGGLLVGVGMLDLTVNGYVSQTIHTLELFDVSWGIFKSVIFALLISWTGCLRGFQVKGGAAGVGQATTSAVVSSIFLIILADSLLVVILRYWE